jgi:hypothetical protein
MREPTAYCTVELNEHAGRGVESKDICMANIMPSVVVNRLFWTLLMPNAVVVYGSGHQ